MSEDEQGVEVNEERIGYSPEIDWTQWQDGKIHTLYRVGARRPSELGPTEHPDAFEQTAAQARRAFIAWAARRKVGTHSSVIDEDTLKVQVTPNRATRRHPRGKRRAAGTTGAACGAGA